MLSPMGRGLACCLSSPSGHQEGRWRVDRPRWFGLTPRNVLLGSRWGMLA